MDFEIPVVEKCCFYFPLRLGMVVYAYFKLVIAIILEIQYSYTLFRLGVKAPWVGLQVAVLLTDTAATIIFIVGCHKRSLTCMTWYYTYSIYLLSVKTCGLFVLSLFHAIPWQPVPNIFIHVYLLFLLRSFIIKLKSQQEAPCEFENKLAYPNCVIKMEPGNHPKPEKIVIEEVIPHNGVENKEHTEKEAEKKNIATVPIETGF